MTEQICEGDGLPAAPLLPDLLDKVEAVRLEEPHEAVVDVLLELLALGAGGDLAGELAVRVQLGEVPGRGLVDRWID